MFSLPTLTRSGLFALATVAVLGIAGPGLTGQAAACEPVYRTVTTYVTHYQPIAKYVTRYDDCGDAYLVRVVTSRPVTVPVTRVVRVY